MAAKTAVVLGATGVSGRSLVAHLTSLPDWSVIAVSRRKPDYATRARHVAVDMSDPAACRAAAPALAEATHVFYTAYVDRPMWVEQRAPNTALLVNMIEALEPVAKNLEHVCLLQGTKYYGHHLGPFKTPAKEDDARHMPPNFYFDQQDYLAAKSRGKHWSWSAARPHIICGFALGTPMNVIAVIAVYAAISKELGLPLRYPASPAAYSAIRQATQGELLARAMVWMATTPSCANEAFNITNGDYFRYEHLWPKIADLFEMPVGAPQRIDLQQFMPDKAELWQTMVARHGLRIADFGRVADWRFATYTFGSDWDQMSDTYKCRRHGFLEFVDTEAMFLHELQRFREERIVP
ncbi:MAG: SDR family oxidoreductase [Bacteroidota bacterium]